ncbi:EMC1 [Symbiodinium natans]|uniref:EMC1 protein n=1 Tax=Symbiodinium natans TaxID=878477 RepID=A0A812TXG2_9DINO|nr:EMC1 [Symbiodinium natans]
MPSLAALAGACFTGAGCGAGIVKLNTATVTPSAPAEEAPKVAATAAPSPKTDKTGGKTRIAQCNCGQLHLTVTGPDPERISLCHCNLCQKQSGNIFAVQARFPKEQVVIEGKSTPWKMSKDEADQLGYPNCVSLGGGAAFHFCPVCGSTVWYTADSDSARVGIKVGCFTDPTFPQPKLSGFESYMHPWALNTAELQVQHLK